MENVTVLIPIGPQKEYLQWVPEAIQSVLKQTYPVQEILLLADGFDLNTDGTFFKNLGFKYTGTHSWGKECWGGWSGDYFIHLHYWRSPWNIGFSQIFNCGVGLADNDLIFYLASDDTLELECVADCLETWNSSGQKDAWYSLTYESSSGGVCSIPINAAMITRNLWKWMGGFPPSAFAGPDALMLSRLMVHAPDRIIKVKPGKVNYHIREHPNQETGRQASFFLTEMDSIRNKETVRFVPNSEIILK